MFRKILFWAHLGSGVVTGLVILMMSVTGVILTYERQMIAWADRRELGEIEATGPRRPIDALIASLAVQEASFVPSSVVVASDPTAPVELAGGRGAGSRYVNPYTGELLGDGALGTQAFFSAMRGWHRWFNVDAEHRGPWRAITGVSNLAFLFLLFSGIYLWLPRVLKWAAFRSRLLFLAKPLNGHARDFNWHHVFGAWSALPLIVVVATATVFSYSWAGDLVYRAFGEEPPSRRAAAAPRPAAERLRATAPQRAAPARPGASAAQAARANATGARPLTASATAGAEAPSGASAALTLDALLGIAAGQVDGWRSITLELPDTPGGDVAFAINQGDGGQPQLLHSLTLDAATGNVVEWAPFESQSPGQQARRWVRYLHTGEALGLVGQTIAGIVSATSIVMVWTGLALAYRRLIVPLLRKRKRREA